jgi:hypothetical protein
METQDINEAMRPIEAAYMATVRSIAEEAFAETDPDGRSNMVWESVDGNEWVIYTYRAQLALVCSENSDAWYEEGGEPATDGAINWSALAYAAMSADVWEYIGVLERTQNVS